MKLWWNLPGFPLSTVMVFNQGWFSLPGSMDKSGEIFGCQKRGNKTEKNSTRPVHRTAPHNKNYVIQNIHSTKVEKPCNTALNGSLSLKCKALQNIVQFPCQTQFLSPCNYSINQGEMIYSWYPKHLSLPLYQSFFYDYSLVQKNFLTPHPWIICQNETKASFMKSFIICPPG